MSIRVSDRVWSNSKHSGNELLMLLAIADFCDDDGRAYPSVATLAKKCRIQVRGAQRLISILRESGELEVQLNAGPKGCNTYIIKPSLPFKPLHGHAPLHNHAPVHGDARRGAQPCAKPLHGGAPEPSLNRQEPSSIDRSTSKSKSGKTVHPLFAEFYTAYPRKVAKPAALKAFCAINPDDSTLQAMLAAIEAQGLAARCAAGDVRFVPHPATWLNGRRWEDQPLPGSGAIGSPTTLRRPVLHADEVFEMAR